MSQAVQVLVRPMLEIENTLGHGTQFNRSLRKCETFKSFKIKTFIKCLP